MRAFSVKTVIKDENLNFNIKENIYIFSSSSDKKQLGYTVVRDISLGIVLLWSQIGLKGSLTRDFQLQVFFS